MINLTIDGKNVLVPEGTTILEAAKSHGIEIPALCYHASMEPYGSCRVCLVEITTPVGSKLVASCSYRAEEGLKVSTDSARAVEARKFIIELLLARCPESEVVRELAKKYGVVSSRFGSSSLTAHDSLTNCILCGLCVRVCDDVVKRNILSFGFRGVNRKPMTPFDKPQEECLACGACAYVCPTGAIEIDDVLNLRKIKQWKTEQELKQCPLCGKKFTPSILFEFLKERLGAKLENADLCPDCRRKQTALRIK